MYISLVVPPPNYIKIGGLEEREEEGRGKRRKREGEERGQIVPPGDG